MIKYNWKAKKLDCRFHSPACGSVTDLAADQENSFFVHNCAFPFLKFWASKKDQNLGLEALIKA